MAPFLYAYVVQDKLSEMYCSATHKESLVHNE